MPAMPEREKELIARILAGETDLFHELIRPYERMVYLSILTMLRNEQEAEDAAQEVMINAFRHLKSFRVQARYEFLEHFWSRMILPRLLLQRCHVP